MAVRAAGKVPREGHVGEGLVGARADRARPHPLVRFATLISDVRLTIVATFGAAEKKPSTPADLPSR
jgi:hypothetical protein